VREKAWSMPRVTIHQRPEICHLGMQFVHNWLRKRPCALCKSCRGMLDLQHSYSNFCALQFNFLEKNPGQSRSAELVLTLGAPERRRRSRVGRAPIPLDCTPRPVSVRRSARCGTPLRRTAFLPHSSCATRRARRGHVAPTLRRLPTRNVAVPPPGRLRTHAHAATWPTRWRARTALQATAAYRRRETHTSPEPRQTHRQYHWRRRGAPPPDPQHHRLTPKSALKHMLKLLVPLVAPAVPSPRRHCACGGRRTSAPPCAPRRCCPALTPATIGPPWALRPRPNSFLDSPVADLAGIRPTAPPPLARGLHCMNWVLSRVVCANCGYICESLILPRVCSQKGSLPFVVFWLNLVNSISNHRKIQKLQTQLCCALCD
jgi:hypothetical protein